MFCGAFRSIVRREVGGASFPHHGFATEAGLILEIQTMPGRSRTLSIIKADQGVPGRDSDNSISRILGNFSAHEEFAVREPDIVADLYPLFLDVFLRPPRGEADLLGFRHGIEVPKTVLMIASSEPGFFASWNRCANCSAASNVQFSETTTVHPHSAPDVRTTSYPILRISPTVEKPT